jgi:hypothetical protein
LADENVVTRGCHKPCPRRLDAVFSNVDSNIIEYTMMDNENKLHSSNEDSEQPNGSCGNIWNGAITLENFGNFSYKYIISIELKNYTPRYLSQRNTSIYTCLLLNFTSLFLVLYSIFSPGGVQRT